MKQLNFINTVGGLYTCVENPLLLFYNDKMTENAFTLPDIQDACGYLIFCSSVPGNLPDAEKRLRLLVRDPYPKNCLHIVWVDDLNKMKDSAELRGIVVSGRKLAERGVIRFRNFLMHLHKDSGVEITSDSIVIHPADSDSSPATLYAQREFTKAGITSGNVVIDAGSPRPGVIKTDIELKEPDLDLLDSGIRLFFNEYNPVKGSGLAGSVRFPVFSTGENILACELLLHPLFLFRNKDEQPETMIRFKSSVPMQSYYRTPLGQEINLIPFIADGKSCQSGLVLERRMETLSGAKSDALYWAPWGTFEIRVDNDTTPELLAGASGTEFIQGGFDGQPFYMTFLSGCQAFLPGFNINNNFVSDIDTASNAFVVNEKALTSYARFHGGDATYFAQPSEQPYYKAQGVEHSSVYLPTPVTNLPVFVPGSIPIKNECVPVLPMSGLRSEDRDAALRLELRMASPVRRAGMKLLQLQNFSNTNDAYNPALKNAAITTRAVTPGGYISEFSGDMSQWKRLIITRGSDDAGSDSGAYLAMNNISGTLRNSFFSNRRCTVFSDPGVFLKSGTNTPGMESPASLKIAGWTFSLDPAVWSKFNVILVFKDHPDTLEELINRPAEWTEGNALNADPWNISSKIKELADIAKLAVENGDEDYKDFYDRIWQNPHWNGFIAFNVPVDPTGFPDELAVIAGGVDPSILKAHHIGVNSASVQIVDGEYEPGRGSLFGLVVYDNDKPDTEVSSWSWRVKKLRAQFINSRLKDFKAEINLRIQELFGEKASLEKDDRKIKLPAPAADPEEDANLIPNSINLTGHYEEHNGKGRYSFTSKEIAKFNLDSGVIESVTLNKTGFDTVSVKSDEKSCTVAGRFSLSGFMGFKRLTGFDVFSYSKLPVNSIALNVSFTVEKNAAAMPKSDISFSIDRMGFQASGADPRDSAIVKNFPVVLDSIRPLNAGAFSSLGLLEVLSPIPQKKKDSIPGYTLNYQIDFNGAGGFSKGLLTLAWWPNGPEPAVTMGLNIPGFSGKFSICDDLIKVGPEKIQFIVEQRSNATVLLFRRIGVQVPFGITLPMGGSIDAAIFGDPSNRSTGKLGWYAAWSKVD
jgi:hypothetical protein